MHDFGGGVSKRWYIDYYVDGIRNRQWIAAKPVSTKPERARKELHKIKNLFKGTNYNLTTIVEKMPLKKKSRQTYLTDVKILSAYCNDLSTLDVLHFRDTLKEKYHPNTVRNKIINLKAVFSFGVEKGFLIEKPFSKIKSVGGKKGLRT